MDKRDERNTILNNTAFYYIIMNKVKILIALYKQDKTSTLS